MIIEKIPEGLTFDDVLLVPARSDVLPTETDTSTQFTRAIRLQIPLCSAAMDTVTEASLAIAIAQQGGIGVVHKNLSIERQAEEVDKVKRSESGMIVDPVTIRQDRPVREALDVMRRYHISGVPVVDEDGHLVGIITNRDLRFETRFELSVSEVMTPQPLVTVPVGTTLDQAKAVLQEHRIEKLLVIDDDKHLKGLITVKDIQKAIKYPTAAKDDLGRLRVAAAIGATGGDAVKVGIGPGSICTTRVVTGAGVPQISAIQSCVEAARGTGVPIISDGGVKFSGDMAKAIAAGADVVMIGSLFAGTEEAPGEVILYQGRSFKMYRGMGSIGAMREGSRDRYSQERIEVDSKLVPEGIEGRVPYRGTLAEMVTQLVGGLRSGMGYTGCRTINEFQEKTRFLRVTAAGLRESHVHDVVITKEAPNYRLE
jgi:IMP dehydrogenase